MDCRRGRAPGQRPGGSTLWAGLGGTSFWVDPREQLIGIWMAQGPGQREHYRGVFKNLVLQSIVE